MTSTQGLIRTQTVGRRTVLALLAALAVTLAGIAAPLATAAHAGGPAAGVSGGESGIAPQPDPYRDARKGGGATGEF